MERTLATNRREQIPKCKTVQEGKGKEDDLGDSGEIYEAGTGNNAQNIGRKRR